MFAARLAVVSFCIQNYNLHAAMSIDSKMVPLGIHSNRNPTRDQVELSEAFFCTHFLLTNLMLKCSLID